MFLTFDWPHSQARDQFHDARGSVSMSPSAAADLRTSVNGSPSSFAKANAPRRNFLTERQFALLDRKQSVSKEVGCVPTRKGESDLCYFHPYSFLPRLCCPAY